MGWKKYWLMVLLIFVVTQPGAIAFANWDAPYGFYRDLAAWMEASFGGLLGIIILEAHWWRKGRLSPAHLTVTVILLGIVVYIGLTADRMAFSEIGITHSLLGFVVGSVLAFALAVMIAPACFLQAVVGELYYPYDRPLVIAWLLMVITALLFEVACLKERGKERPTQPEG